jgi:tRNA-Thr(GGU) m(6)t(6)A37 methyltransferase TsaA
MGENMSEIDYTLHPIGVIRSTLTSRESAPRQGYEGAPDAWIEIGAPFADALRGIAAGDALIVLTWFHQSARDTLLTHPRNEISNPLAGVFATRSPDRPNPIGLHRVTVREIDGLRLKVGPIEAIDGTPVIDLKPVVAESADS